LKPLQSWMTKKPILGHQEKQKRDQESLIQEKRLMSLKPGSEKVLINIIKDDIYRRHNNIR